MAINIMKTLKENKNRLTTQQYKTLKGQILNKDENGALRGLMKILYGK